MKFSKFIPLSLAAFATMGLASCGGGTPVVGTELIVWATADEKAVLDVAVDKYNERCESDSDKIYLTYKAVQEGDAGTELAKNPSAATAPDSLLMVDDHVAGLASVGTLLTLTGTSYASDITTKHVTNAVAGVTYDSKLYGFPVSNDNGYFLYYNKTVLGSGEVDTLEHLMDKAAQLNKIVNIDFGTGYYDVMPFIGAGGTLDWFETPSGNKYHINWDDASLVARAKALSDLLVANASFFETGGDSFAAEGFANGSVIATVRGTWAYKDLIDALNDSAENPTKLGAVKLPTFQGQQLGSFTGVKLYSINAAKGGADATTRRQKAAKFANLLVSKEMELVRFEKRATIPSRMDAQEDPRFADHKNITIEALMAQNAAASIIQSQSAEGNYWSVGGTIGQAIVSGQVGEAGTWQNFMTQECDILRPAA